MIILMKPEATAEQVQAVLNKIGESGYKCHPSVLETSAMISVADFKTKAQLDLEVFRKLPGVTRVLGIRTTIPETQENSSS